MRLRASLLVIAGIFFFAACGSGESYPTGESIDDVDLGAMSLIEADLPVGFTKAELPDPEYNNDRWVSEILNPDDPEVTLRQLEAQGRLKGYVSSYGPAELGPVFSVISFSTVYTDPEAARRSTVEFNCGMPLENAIQRQDFYVPKLGDDSAAFFVRNVPSPEEGGITTVDTNICFRTGRIVHAIQQTSLPGTEDVGLSVSLAQRMLRHVEDTFEGTNAEGPQDDEG